MRRTGKDTHLECLILSEVHRRGRPEKNCIHHLPLFPGYDRAQIEDYAREMIAEGLIRPAAGLQSTEPERFGKVGFEGLTRRGEDALSRCTVSFWGDVALAWRAERGEWFWRFVAVALGGAAVAAVFG